MTYREDHYDVSGVDTAVLTAGDGPPLVFLHGGGTATGFDPLLPLAERFRLIVPHHPGFGASADDPAVDSLHDYVLHYLDLVDELGLDQFALAGHSLGGNLAALFAIQQAERVRRLVLAAPIGLTVPDHPTVDFFSLDGEEVMERLTADPSIFAGPPPSPEFLADRYREATSLARIGWKRPPDRKLRRWLHRVTTPTLVLWGDLDRMVPVEQAQVWVDLLPNAETRVLPGVGHLLFDESREAVDAIGDFVGAEVAA